MSVSPRYFIIVYTVGYSFRRGCNKLAYKRFNRTNYDKILIFFAGPISAINNTGNVDDNGRRWVQPLFAPENKIYESRAISTEEYAEEKDVRIAEKCFANPELW